MGMMINKVVEPIWGYEPINGGGMVFVAKGALTSYQRENKRRKPLAISLPGRDRSQETAYFFENARALARMARGLADNDNVSVGAVLFRDTDGAQSAGRSERFDKVKSMLDGFLAEGFQFGVPMVPKPKSEAWLLCALQNRPYQNCARLEDISGNDDSHNPAKEQLDEALGFHANAVDLADLVTEGKVDVRQIDMPSFNEFRERMTEVARAMLSGPEEPGQTRP